MAEDAKTMIARAIDRFLDEVPALSKLKLVLCLELRGRGDVQLFRIEMPGPRIEKDPAPDAKVRLSISRSHFNELAKDGRVRHWREAFEQGHARVEGSDKMIQLVAAVVERQEGRSRTRKARG